MIVFTKSFLISLCWLYSPDPQQLQASPGSKFELIGLLLNYYNQEEQALLSWLVHGFWSKRSPGLILGDFNVCFDFLLIRVAIALNTLKMEHWQRDGVKGAPLASSIDTSFVTEGPTDVK